MRMTPEPDASESAPSAAELVDALSRLPPRSSQLLGYRVLDARPLAECARLYGVSEAAISVHVLRAARLLEAALASPGKQMLPSKEAILRPDDEAREARALADWLDSSQRSTDGGDGTAGLGQLLLHVRALTPEVRQLAEARAREEMASPAHRRAEWLRRLALLALVALALWLYLR